jgi:hypothetical protein
LKERTKLTSVERGCLLIVIASTNAVGTYISPVMKWSRKNVKAQLVDGAVSGSVAAWHYVSGWTEMEIFAI